MISWVLSNNASKSQPERFRLHVVGMRSSNRVTAPGSVREYVLKTEPGDNYNITIISENGAGRTASQTTVAKLPATGIYNTITSQR